jgi:hypothetical protein
MHIEISNPDISKIPYLQFLILIGFETN